MRRKLVLFALVLCGLTLGFVQERMKISLNFTIECANSHALWEHMTAQERSDSLEDCRLDRPSDYYYNHDQVDVYTIFTLAWLTRFKWLLSGLGILVFWTLNYFLLRSYYDEDFSGKPLHVGYVAMVMGAGGIFILGRLTGWSAQLYPVAREILGAMQSMIPAVVLILGLTIKKRAEHV